MAAKVDAVVTDLTLSLSYGDLLQLRVFLERERLRQQQAGASLRAVDRLIERVEQALFPHSDFSSGELVTVAAQSGIEVTRA